MTITPNRQEKIAQNYLNGVVDQERSFKNLLGSGFFPSVSGPCGHTLIGRAVGTFPTSKEKTKQIAQTIVNLVEDGGNFNQRDEYGTPIFFSLFDPLIFTLAISLRADLTLTDRKGKNCWCTFVSRLNSNVVNDRGEKTVPLLPICMREMKWNDDLKNRQDLMAFESLVSRYWESPGNCWDELWGKRERQMEERVPSMAVTDIYLEAYKQSLLFITLPCHMSGRQYWEAKKRHSPVHRICEKTPPLFGILLLVDPNGVALLKKWIIKGELDPRKTNWDGKNMLFSAVLADAGEEFCCFLEERSVQLKATDELLQRVDLCNLEPVERRLILAAEQVQIAFELAMILTLWSRYGSSPHFHEFWKEQIERIGLVNLLLFDHQCADVAAILSTEAVASLHESFHEEAIFALLTDQRAPRSEGIWLYLTSHTPSRLLAKRIFHHFLQNEQILNLASFAMDYLIQAGCADEVAPDRGPLHLKDFFLLQLINGSASKEAVQRVSKSYPSSAFIARIILSYPQIVDHYFPSHEWSLELRNALNTLIDDHLIFPKEFSSSPDRCYLLPLLVKAAPEKNMDSLDELSMFLINEKSYSFEKEKLLSMFRWKSDSLNNFLRKDPYSLVSSFKELIPDKEVVECFTIEQLASYKKLLLAYHYNDQKAFDQISHEEFLALLTERNGKHPLIPHPVFERSWFKIAQGNRKSAKELAWRLYQNPLITHKIAENYLYPTSLYLRKDGHSNHRFANLAIPLIKGFLKNDCGAFCRRNKERADLYKLAELDRRVAGSLDYFPESLEELPELREERPSSFTIGHLLFLPTHNLELLHGYRFSLPGEATHLQVIERLSSEIYGKYFSAPRPMEGGFYWVKNLPSWVKKMLQGHINDKGPYLVSVYEVEKKQLERLDDPLLNEERFQEIRDEILKIESALILSNLSTLRQHSSLGSDILLMNMLHLQVEEGIDSSRRLYRFAVEEEERVELHQKGARSSMQKRAHPLKGRLLAHSALIVVEEGKSERKWRKTHFGGRFCVDEWIMRGSGYEKAKYSMNFIAAILRYDATWLIERLQRKKPLDYQDSNSLSWLADELKRGAAQLLTHLTNLKEESFRFCNEGPFHWQQAAKELIYWRMDPRPDLPQDLYPPHINVEVDPHWDPREGPEACITLEESWYHASLFGYLLGHEEITSWGK